MGNFHEFNTFYLVRKFPEQEQNLFGMAVIKISQQYKVRYFEILDDKDVRCIGAPFFYAFLKCSEIFPSKRRGGIVY